jgi:hypothetical protein
LDAEKNARSAGDDSVSGQGLSWWRRYVMNEVGMNLAKSDEWPRVLSIRRSEFFQKGGAIAFDRRSRILLGESKVESVSAVSTGVSSGSGAEAVNEPGNPSQGVTLENFDFCFLWGFCGHLDILAIGDYWQLRARARTTQSCARVIIPRYPFRDTYVFLRQLFQETHDARFFATNSDDAGGSCFVDRWVRRPAE